jgi:fido (protein-threonine AMPylation protein)
LHKTGTLGPSGRPGSTPGVGVEYRIIIISSVDMCPYIFHINHKVYKLVGPQVYMVKVRVKSRGDKRYYYLEHSIRRGKNVVKKEKYLGTKLPEEIDLMKDEFLKEIQKELYTKLEKIRGGFQDEWKRLPRSAKDKELEEISINFTYNTNAIEGSTITEYEAREIITHNISVNKPLRDVKETEAHSKIFLEMLFQKGKITNRLLLKWHQKIFGDTKEDISGKFRLYNVRVGSYIAPDWQKVKKLMDELIMYIDKNKKMNPVELSARAHYKFESIHPFGDGNGRIGRLLMNHILWHAGYPILVIEYKKRKTYYNAFPKGEDYFVSYYIKRYLAVYKKYSP